MRYRRTLNSYNEPHCQYFPELHLSSAAVLVEKRSGRNFAHRRHRPDICRGKDIRMGWWGHLLLQRSFHLTDACVCAEGSRAAEKIGFSLSPAPRCCICWFPQDTLFAQTFLICASASRKGANSFREMRWEKIFWCWRMSFFICSAELYIIGWASLSLLNIMEWHADWKIDTSLRVL
jgi:hypothetical protein